MDVLDLKKQEVEQNNGIIGVGNQIEKLARDVDTVIDKCRVYYDFLMNTPLKNFIPPNITLNGKLYSNLENEFLLFYRMVKGSDKLCERMEKN